MADNRIVDLESRIAFQEYQLGELSSQIEEQQKQILELEALCRSIVKRMKSGSAAGEGTSEIDERPPHY